MNRIKERAGEGVKEQYKKITEKITDRSVAIK